MLRTSVILLLLICVQASFGQLSGNLSGTLGPGSYDVVGQIAVATPDTLRILPGTTFSFSGPYSFTIHGTLLAEGTAEDSICFTSDLATNPDRWRALVFWGNESSGSRLVYCSVENSAANGGVSGYGGGVFCYEASPVFRHCRIRNCEAGYGGGLYVYLGSPTFENCAFTHNQCGGGGGGGGVRVSNTAAVFTNCIVAGNIAVYGGGLFCSSNTTASFVHCTFSGNSGVAGGGIYLYECAPTIRSTIVAYTEGVGIYFNNSAGSQITHCCVYGNDHGPIDFEDHNPVHGPAGIAILSNTNANGDPCDAYSNILLNPRFVESPTNDLHLGDSSACVGAASLLTPPPFDFDGNPRPLPAGSIPDIGAFEHGQISPPVQLVIAVTGSSVVLRWSSPEASFNIYIYGSGDPAVLGDLLDSVSATTWTDTDFATRPSPYFYTVTASAP